LGPPSQKCIKEKSTPLKAPLLLLRPKEVGGGKGEDGLRQSGKGGKGAQDHANGLFSHVEKRREGRGGGKMVAPVDRKKRGARNAPSISAVNIPSVMKREGKGGEGKECRRCRGRERADLRRILAEIRPERER